MSDSFGSAGFIIGRVYDRVRLFYVSLYNFDLFRFVFDFG